MGISTGEPFDARSGNGSHCRIGRTQAPQICASAGKGLAAGLIALILGTCAAVSDTLRVATWHVELTRRGPGLLVRDIQKDDPAALAVIEGLVANQPDVVFLTDIDWDFGDVAISMLVERLSAQGLEFPNVLTRPPNSGQATDLDLDGNGYFGDAGDAQGWGRFRGAGAMALLSRYPIATVDDHTNVLWAEVDDAVLPTKAGRLFPSPEAYQVQRLHSVGAWDVTLVLGQRHLRLLTLNAGTPVFDGPEDRNGHRNRDEVRYWLSKLSDVAGPPVVVLGNANLDPFDGNGERQAIHELIGHPRLFDPQPKSLGAVEASAQDGGVNALHQGDPALDTADWKDTDGGPGNLRVSYVLPETSLVVMDAGVDWTMTNKDAPRHKLVWVDLKIEP